MFRRPMRIMAAFAGVGAGAWAFDVTINDEWDEHFRFGRAHVAPEDKPRVVVLGSGWGAASFIKKVDLDKYQVTVVSPRNYFLFTPMLAGSTVGTVEQRSIIEPIRSLLARCNAADAAYLQAECTAVNTKTNTITCKDMSNVRGNIDTFELPYDHLVVSIGCKPATFGIPGVEKNALFMKEVDDAKKIRDRVYDCLETAALPGQAPDVVKKLLNFIVVGGGPSGVEFAAELHDFLKQDVTRLFPTIKREDIKITLFDVLPHVLPMFDKTLVEYTESNLARQGVALRTSTKVTEVGDHQLTVVNPDKTQEKVPFGALVWVAGITTRPVISDLIKALGHKTPRGLMVDGWLQVQGTNNIWALGDCAISGNPPTAQVASQEGRYLARLFNKVTTKNVGEFNEVAHSHDDFHYAHKGSFAYVGGSEAIAQVPGQAAVVPVSGDIQVSGRTAWIAWRTVYMSKLLSARNRLQVGLDWCKAMAFGRDTSRI